VATRSHICCKSWTDVAFILTNILSAPLVEGVFGGNAFLDFTVAVITLVVIVLSVNFRIFYRIGDYFIPWIVYGEADLTDEETAAIEGLEHYAMTETPGELSFSHWEVTDDRDEFARCEATGLMGACVTIHAVYL